MTTPHDRIRDALRYAEFSDPNSFAGALDDFERTQTPITTAGWDIPLDQPSLARCYRVQVQIGENFYSYIHRLGEFAHDVEGHPRKGLAEAVERTAHLKALHEMGRQIGLRA